MLVKMSFLQNLANLPSNILDQNLFIVQKLTILFINIVFVCISLGNCQKISCLSRPALQQYGLKGASFSIVSYGT